MNKSVLYMVTRLPDPVRDGYIRALEACGYKVYRCHPNNKLEIISLIDSCNIQMIFSESKYGVRQLPIDKINQNGIMVIINALPLNPNKNYIDGPYRLADPKEPEILSQIDNLVVHTNIFPYAWEKYMQGWVDSEIDLLYVPYAGDMYVDLPKDLSLACYVSIHGDNNHLRSILIDRLNILYLSFHFNVFPAIVYAHISDKPCLTYEGFQHKLFGGYWIDNISIDGPLTNTQFIQEVEISSLVDEKTSIARSLDIYQNAVKNHTYFNRLCDIFNHLNDYEESQRIKIIGDRIATQFVWQWEARLEATKEGEVYEEVQFI